MDQYQRIFETWNVNRPELSITNKDETFVYKAEPDEEIRRCYLSKNNGEIFFKARHALPKHWWISEKGIILTVYRGTVQIYRGHVKTEKNRLYTEIPFQRTKNGKREEIRLTLQFEALKALVFADVMKSYNHITITEDAKKMVESYGLIVFSQKECKMDLKRHPVTIHHTYQYIPGMSYIDALKLLSQNSALDKIEMMTVNEHNSMMGYASINDILTDESQSLDESIAQLKAFREASPNNNKIIIFRPVKGKEYGGEYEEREVTQEIMEEINKGIQEYGLRVKKYIYKNSVVVELNEKDRLLLLPPSNEKYLDEYYLMASAITETIKDEIKDGLQYGVHKVLLTTSEKENYTVKYIYFEAPLEGEDNESNT